MEMPRLTLLQSMILLANLGLLCSLPIQCQRAAKREDCRIMAEIRASTAQELTLMADHAANWTQEFRPELRWLAARQRETSRRLEQSGFFDEAEEERIATAEIAAHGLNLNQFWARFNSAAARHGFQRPKLGPGHWETGIDRWLARCWPTFVAIALLTWTLRLFSRRRVEREV
jgi:hypothetical protein